MNALVDANTFETIVGSGQEAARFDAAFFRYVRDCASPDGWQCLMMADALPDGEHEKKTVVFGNHAAANDFASFWRAVGRLAASPLTA
jgi:hypothetical protein